MSWYSKRKMDKRDKEYDLYSARTTELHDNKMVYIEIDLKNEKYDRKVINVRNSDKI